VARVAVAKVVIRPKKLEPVAPSFAFTLNALTKGDDFDLFTRFASKQLYPNANTPVLPDVSYLLKQGDLIHRGAMIA